MATTDSIEMAVLIFVLLAASSVAGGRRGWNEAFSQEEHMEMERRLNAINKTPVKSFKTEYGDVLDCIEIHKQPAFDHPLLKNHTIQMKPETNLKKMSNRISSESSSSPPLPRIVHCPRGTVPIKRIQKEDLIMEKLISSSFLSKFSSSRYSYSNPSNQDGHQLAGVSTTTKNYGVQGSVNLWSPEVAVDEFSLTYIFAATDPTSGVNAVQTGWAGDGGKTTGCFNVVCPGFVQVSTEMPVGLILRPVSSYDGAQYAVKLSLELDRSSRNWWLHCGAKHIGYWPGTLFGTLADGATRGGWGGEVYGPPTKPSPAMGSGHFPEEGFRKSCFISQMKLIDESYHFFDPDDRTIRVSTSKPKCYDVKYVSAGGEQWYHRIYFGGPPNCKLQ
ncbi:hypothetical protein Nepgr_024541 [Nepenthes gracilis]|uniref:Neprosin PEP catalytic domain-containing protein n=1 Tax=Nepenthes gracilis TaxID=150966 RepID=A0AAD3T310_NEPGR|nr:hypothetical protein Nepgr_024541 [Nepenthes gracilis]